MTITIEQILEALRLGYEPLIVLNGEWYELQEGDDDNVCNMCES